MGERRRPVIINDRKQEAVQYEIRSRAFELFVNQGFESTTVEEIAEAAGISRRTYFRYFDTKEDVVILALNLGGDTLEELLRRRPSDEDALTATRQALAELLVHFQSTSEHAWEILTLIQSTPKLRARFLLEREQWCWRIQSVLVDRGIPESEAAIISHVAGGILMHVYEQWHGDRDLAPDTAVHQAFESLKHLYG